jgi:diaminopimelate epimerase
MRPSDPLTVGPAFFKGHGLGNDYLVMEEATEPSASDTLVLRESAIRRICDRWRGVGADGIVVLLRGDRDPWGLRMFNPDGSEFERSGNGLRILASFLARRGRVGASAFGVEVGGSRISMTVHSASPTGSYDVSVEMGEARFGPREVGLEVNPDDPRLAHPTLGRLDAEFVSVGNPHAVVFPSADRGGGGDDGGGGPGAVEFDLDDLANEVGPFLATNSAFVAGTNVQVVHARGPGVIEIRIWERGVGPTSASGTSACAAASAAVRRGLQEPGAIRVEAPGGALTVTVEQGWNLTLRGPVQAVMEGRLDTGLVRSLAD